MWMISFDRVALLTFHIKTTTARTPSFEKRPLWPINLGWNLRDRSISHPAAALFRLQGTSWKQRAVAALWVWRSLGPADPELIFSAVNGWTFLLRRQMLCVRNSLCPSMNQRPSVWDYLCVCDNCLRCEHPPEDLTEYWEQNMCFWWACPEDRGILHSAITLK